MKVSELLLEDSELYSTEGKSFSHPTYGHVFWLPSIKLGNEKMEKLVALHEDKSKYFMLVMANQTMEDQVNASFHKIKFFIAPEHYEWKFLFFEQKDDWPMQVFVRLSNGMILVWHLRVDRPTRATVDVLAQVVEYIREWMHLSRRFYLEDGKWINQEGKAYDPNTLMHILDKSPGWLRYITTYEEETSTYRVVLEDPKRPGRVVEILTFGAEEAVALPVEAAVVEAVAVEELLGEVAKLVLVDPFLCWNCGKKAGHVCRNCNTAHYCSAECQRKHWKLHEGKCKEHAKKWAAKQI